MNDSLLNLFRRHGIGECVGEWRVCNQEGSKEGGFLFQHLCFCVVLDDWFDSWGYIRPVVDLVAFGVSVDWKILCFFFSFLSLLFYFLLSTIFLLSPTDAARTHILQPDNRQPDNLQCIQGGINKQASTTVFTYRNKLSRHINLQSSNLSRIASYTLVRVPSQLHVWHSLMLRRNVSYRITSYSIPSFITMHAASCWPTDSAQRM